MKMLRSYYRIATILCAAAGFVVGFWSLLFLGLGSLLVEAQNESNPAKEAKSHACPNDDTGLKLPAGFCATVFADHIGHARHMVAAPSGVLYVNTWSGRYYGNATPHAGGFLVALRDQHGVGRADVIERFGETVQSGGHGGTGSAWCQAKHRVHPGLLGRMEPFDTRVRAAGIGADGAGQPRAPAERDRQHPQARRRL